MGKIEHIEKKLYRTIDVIEELFKPKYYEVGFNHIGIDKAVVKTTHSKEGFYFEFAKMVLTSQQDAQKLFDRDDEIITFSDFYNKIIFKIKDCKNFNFSVGFSGYTKVSGFIKDFETKDINDYSNCFYRATILTEELFTPSKYFKLSKSLKVKEVFYGCGILELEIDNININLFPYNDKITGRNYFIIETINNGEFINFKNIIDEIILAITYLTGTFLGNSVIFLGSKNNSFDEVKLLGIKSFFDDLKNSFAVIPDLHYHREIIGNLNDFAESKHLEKLIDKIQTNLIYKRTILLICQAHSEPNYVKATLYSVALETITNLISELLETKNKPITDKATATKIRTELKKVLIEYKGTITIEAYKKIEGDLERINSMTNKQKLLLPFEFYNYTLEKKDIEAIEGRNNFLHGRIPENSDKHHLSIIVGRLLFCVNFLVLKYIGFSGYIFYPAVMYQINNKLETDDEVLKAI
ncbi:MAG: hypothetical protein CFE24_10085 [Flavobacterium sp. BFFFF2]|nr:MAG: hypothetical protein CFE24_10085 [Flavobacterium sp. BFFFF2]